MKRCTPILLMVALVAAAAGCSQTRKNTVYASPGTSDPHASEQEVRYYSEAVESLGEKLAFRLKMLPRKSQDASSDSFYIYNADAKDGMETELARRFIGDLTDKLVNESIKLKRKEMVSWSRVTGGELTVECEEVLEQASSDHLLEFRLGDCPEAFNCKVAKVRLIDGSDILLTEKSAFFLSGNPALWAKRLKYLEPKPGDRQAPYEDSREAARQMVGRIACFLNHMLPDSSDIRIVVGKTDRTSEDAAVAVSHAVSFYGFHEVPPTKSRWMKVVMDTQGGFQLGMYETRKNRECATANVVIAFDVAPVSSELLHAKATVLAMEDIAIVNNGILQTIKNGMVFPKCVDDAYIKRHLPPATPPRTVYHPSTPSSSPAPTYRPTTSVPEPRPTTATPQPRPAPSSSVSSSPAPSSRASSSPAPSSPAATSWADETIIAEGVGICNKEWDRALWQESARKAAELDAKAKLCDQVMSHVQASMDAEEYKIRQYSIRGNCRAYIRRATVVSETFDEKTCLARVKVAAKASDVIPDLKLLQNTQPGKPNSRNHSSTSGNHSSTSGNHTSTSGRSLDAPRENPRTVYTASRSSGSVPSASAAEIRRKANDTTIRELERMLKQKLADDGVTNRAQTLLTLAGTIEMPNCHAEEDTDLLPQGVVPPHYCFVNYDLDLQIRSRPVLHCSHRAKGIGRNKNKAWQDAYAGIVEYIHPIALDFAHTLDQRITLEELRAELDMLNQAHWNVAQDLDTDAMLSFIERQIEVLGE